MLLKSHLDVDIESEAFSDKIDMYNKNTIFFNGILPQVFSFVKVKKSQIFYVIYKAKLHLSVERDPHLFGILIMSEATRECVG